eukprot:m.14216 g.14216  ORF g.14216 m.14216 type:complete len:115 (+) comp4759_c0_seq1:269-613(+)
MSAPITFSTSGDPFDAETEAQVGSSVTTGNLIHVRIQQRSGRKTLTTVQGIGEEFDQKKLVKAFKKQFACNGCVVTHQEYGEVIQLQGDQRQKVGQFLVDLGIANEGQVKLHGG